MKGRYPGLPRTEDAVSQEERRRIMREQYKTPEIPIADQSPPPPTSYHEIGNRNDEISGRFTIKSYPPATGMYPESAAEAVIAAADRVENKPATVADVIAKLSDAALDFEFRRVSAEQMRTTEVAIIERLESRRLELEREIERRRRSA